MADYDFSTLNSSDLEELVCDLLTRFLIISSFRLIKETSQTGF
jgi:hypothetical protein